MQLLILIEPLEGGRFRAQTGAPFTLTAEGATKDEAEQRLSNAIQEQLQRGVQLATLSVPHRVMNSLQFDPLPEDDWFFRTLREAIAENRRLEDEVAP